MIKTEHIIILSLILIFLSLEYLMNYNKAKNTVNLSNEKFISFDDTSNNLILNDVEKEYYLIFLYKIFSINEQKRIIDITLLNDTGIEEHKITFNNAKKLKNDAGEYLPGDATIDNSILYEYDNICKDNSVNYSIEINDIKTFTLTFSKNNENLFKMKFVLNVTLPELYNNLIPDSNLGTENDILILDKNFISEIVMIKDTVETSYNNIEIKEIAFVKYIENKITKSNNDLEKKLEKKYSLSKQYTTLEKNIEKLNNYYKLQKNIQQNYLPYKIYFESS